MAAQVILVEATPRQGSDGAGTPVRLAGGGGARPYRYGGEHWRAGIAALPRAIRSLDFKDGVLGGGGVAEASEISWAPATRAALAELASLVWADAPIAIRIGAEGDALPPVVSAGLVLESAVTDGQLRIALADAAADLKRPLLVDRFAGTGGVEGSAEWKDRIKTRAWGRCFNVPGQMLKKATNIVCFGDPGRPWQAFEEVRDRGVAAAAGDLTVLGWQGSIAATFAALDAAVAPSGGGVLCPSIACVKWWTQPAGDLRADIRGENAGGYAETAPEIAARIVAARSTLAVTDLAAAIAARPGLFGWRVDQDGATAAGELSHLLAGVSLSWLIEAGAVTFRPWDWSVAVRSGRSHAVTRREVVRPVGARRLGYRRNWAKMARGDLASFAELVPMGDWSADVTYHEGNVVQHQGSSWYFINPSPAAGIAPPELPAEENAHWRLLARAGKDGVSAYAILLTNESHILPAAADGSVVTYNGASTSVAVYAAGADASASFALSVVSNPQALAVAIAGKTATVTSGLDAGEPNATLMLRMTGTGAFAGVVLDKQFSLTKSRAGADGDSPPLITIAAASQTVRYDGADAIVSGDIEVTTLRTASDQAPRFTITSIDGTVHGQAGATAAELAAGFGNSFATTGPDQLLLKQAWLNTVMQDFGGEVRVLAAVAGAADAVSIVKIRDGENAAVVTMELSANAAGFDAAGVLKTGDITVTVARQNVAGPTLFTIRSADGSYHGGTPDKTAAQLVASSPASFGSAGPDQLVLKAAWIATVLGGGFGSRFTVQAGAGGAAASGSVVRVDDGVAGGDGYALEVSVAGLTVPAGYLGAVKSGALPLPFAVKVTKGTADVTAAAAISFAGSSSGVAVAGAGAAGSYQLTAIGAGDGYVNVTVSHGGFTFPARRVPIAKRLDAPPPSSIQSSSRAWDATIASGSFEEANAGSTAAIITAGGSGSISFSAFGTYFVVPSTGGIRNFTAAGKVQYRSGGGPWLDAGAAVNGTTASFNPADGPEAGTIAVDGVVSGLTSGANYEFRFIGRRTTPSNEVAVTITGGTLSLVLA